MSSSGKTASGQPIKGRGASDNPANRYEGFYIEPEPEYAEEGASSPDTRFIRDDSARILAFNNSPDVPFTASLNPYRGCEHGCIYCYARPTHEYLGYSPGLEFESRILIKEDAPQLLRRELAKPSWQPRTIAVSGVTDPYQPVEREKQLTRACLKVLGAFQNPFGIVTKNHLVARDWDLIAPMAELQAAMVHVSISTLDGKLTEKLEPRTTRPHRRLEAIRQLAEAGIPVGVLVAPVIPGLNDQEIPEILRQASQVGARFAGYVMLRLPGAVRPLFENWLEEHFPGRSGKIISRISSVRGGGMNDTEFGRRMRGEGVYADQVEQMMRVSAGRYGLNKEALTLSTCHFQVPGRQMDLF